jgi:hypothetical protein
MPPLVRQWPVETMTRSCAADLQIGGKHVQELHTDPERASGATRVQCRAKEAAEP